MARSLHTNRLSKETSPYLLQHQHNPVDWYAWGEDAFERARRENKPIFLSVGYSTCYWCHVMERECFENETIAELMNRHFVCIKVDREERPDVDQLYMTAVQIMTGQGGWPMSVWLTPDLRPFYGGTYFPPRDAHGRMGFPRVLEALAEAYRDRPEDIEKSASDLAKVLKQNALPRNAAQAMPPLDHAMLDAIIRGSTADYEPRFGGFGHAPKFPRQTLLRLLLTWLESKPHEDANRERIAKMLHHTLRAMANGGIRDHLGGGFHRYSTDAKWLVPHFEIMLYDQAMLAPVYARAARILNEPRYASVARGICDFVLREMTGPDGEFYTALDAEVDHREGLNYLWTPQQIESVLGTDNTMRFNAIYGLDEGPNFADPHHGNGIPDANILFLPDGSIDESEPMLIAMRLKLREARATRKQPLLDTKVITSWNALMIEALAIVSRELNEPTYKDAAVRCVDFLLREHIQEDSSLWRTSRNGVKKYAGFLDDYAAFALALLELHTTSRDVRWKIAADVVVMNMLRLFGDPHAGGLYFTASGATDLIVRQKTGGDSPLPAGNALAALALHQMGLDMPAKAILDAFAFQMREFGEGMSTMVEAAWLVLQRDRQTSDIHAPAPRIGTRQAIVSLAASRVSDRRIEVDVVIDPNYHIHDTNTDPQLGLHATRLRVEGAAADQVAMIDYPPATLLQLPFGPPLMAYVGNLTIAITFVVPLTPEPIELSLSFQACDESTCLRPAIATASV